MTSDTSHCDVAVIGAGISGLAAAHRLKALRPDLDVCLFEKSDVIGGRILSHSIPNDAGIVELGAGRYHRVKHPLLDSLMSEFGVKVRPFSYQVAPLQFDLFEHNREILKTICWRMQTFHDECPDTERDRLSFWEAARLALGEQKRQLLVTASGYDSLANEKLPLPQGMGILFGHPETSSLNGSSDLGWAYPEEGFHKLPEALFNVVRQQCRTYLSHQLKRVERLSSNGKSGYRLGFGVGSDHRMVITEKVIQATPLQDVFAIDGFAFSTSLETSVINVPLMKGYVQYQHPWWREIGLDGLCFTNPTAFRKIYFPPSGNQLLIYADGNSALQLNNMINNGNKVHLHFNETLKQALPFGAFKNHLPQPVKHEWKFWERGISFWDGGLNLLPDALWALAKNYYVCSDLCTNEIGWTEGALQSVESVISRLSHDVPRSLHDRATGMDVRDRIEITEGI